MNLLKKITAAIMILVISVSFAACSNPTWVSKTDDVTVTPGIYVGMLIQAYNQASTMVTDTTKDILSQKIKVEDKEVDAETYIQDEALKLMKNFIAVEQEFKKLNLTLSDEDKALVDENVDYYWSQQGEVFEKNGCGEQSYRAIIENSMKSDLIFKKYYSEGGLEEVKTEDLKAYFKENYANAKFIVFSKTDSSGAALAEDKLTQLKETANKYLDDAKKENADFDILIKKYSAEQQGTSTDDITVTDEERTSNMTLVSKSDTQYPEAFVNTVFKMENDSVELVDDSNYYIVVKRFDVMADEKTFTENKESTLWEMKGEEFTQKIEKAANEIKLEVNDSAIKKFKVKNIKLS